jgi:hypothetical protein
MNEHHRRGIVSRVLRNAKGGNRIWWLSRGSANELSCTSKNVKYLLNK